MYRDGGVMRAHVILNGVIHNTIEVDSMDFIPDQGYLIPAEEGGIGDQYIDGTIVPAPIIVPEKVVVTKEELMARIVEIQAQIDAMK